eukprot:GFUD01067171.1.p1 GENE.GFUD01067171.1~~GFUD01067171.1.p1  ORF type:complete len:209 (-),score=41.13 GFUD01067171.1:59-685(-)
MSEELFYHYSTMAGAKAIFLSGKLHPNLAVNGPAVHGDGVYLTTMDPKRGREQVGRNNWDGITRRQDQKMESYFEILLPSKKVKRAKERRNIQVHTGVLHLASYKWSLRAWNGDLLATQHFMVSSDGEAAQRHGYAMGRYTLCSNIATLDNQHWRPDWCAGSVAVDNTPALLQLSNNSPSPHETIPWKYAVDDSSWQDDENLRVCPVY